MKDVFCIFKGVVPQPSTRSPDPGPMHFTGLDDNLSSFLLCISFVFPWIMKHLKLNIVMKPLGSESLQNKFVTQYCFIKLSLLLVVVLFRQNNNFV